MRAIIISVLFLFFGQIAGAEEIEYLRFPLAPANTLARELGADYPWKFAGCIAVIDMTVDNEPIVGYRPTYDLVYEDDPAHNTYTSQEDMNDMFLIGGSIWLRFDRVIFDTLCNQGT